MAVRRVEVENTGSETIGVGTAIQAAIFSLVLLLSPLLYDIWRLLGGS